MKGKRHYRFSLILSISCLFVSLPFAGHGAGLVIGNDVTVNGDLFVTAQSPFWGYGSGTFSINFANKILTIALIPDGLYPINGDITQNRTAPSNNTFPILLVCMASPPFKK